LIGCDQIKSFFNFNFAALDQLATYKFTINSVHGHQLGVRTSFLNLAFLHHQNFVGISNRAQAMSYYDYCLIS